MGTRFLKELKKRDKLIIKNIVINEDGTGKAVLEDDCFKIKVSVTYRKKIKDYKLSIKCGDCNSIFNIYFGDRDSFIECGGVAGSLKLWKDIFDTLFTTTTVTKEIKRNK